MSLSPSQTSLSAVPFDSGSDNVASKSSTPPTSLSDNVSVASGTIKVESTPAPEIVVVDSQPQQTPASGRARRARAGNPTYNLAQLSGTAGHGKRRANGDEVSGRKRRNISGDTLVEGAESSHSDNHASGSTDNLVRDGVDALDLQWSMNNLETPKPKRQKSDTPRNTRASTRFGGGVADTIVAKATSLGKRSRKAFDQGMSKMSRELRRLQDTKEFAHIDERPVLHTVWANGKFVTPAELEANNGNPPPRKKTKTEEPEGIAEEVKPRKTEDGIEMHTRKGRRTKRWLDKGLYAGQDAPQDITKGLSAADKKKLATLPELAASTRTNKALPLPMFNGLRTLINGRDFKLPFDVCNPLPPGQPKPEHWTKISKNRFVGDSSLYWKKSPHLSDDGSKCICKPQDGCGDDCQNRIMLYECNDKNCNIGKDKCTNRAFADLQERKAGGGKYRTGVEVIKTSDRGYGVRSNRCFEANQIIMEYTGEIITEEECENRMNTKYKNNDCYYLMSFDQNMIIDATNGSIARFVNHSCKPNCRMIKWIVSGQPRMALFAGDAPIMTGDELTYDYNFDPFSAKNVQVCLCGEVNCRGVLGPKPKDQKPAKAESTDVKKTKAKATAKATAQAKAKAKSALKPAPSKAKTTKDAIKETMKGVVKAGKRKLEELVGNDDDEHEGGSSPKKRKVKATTGIKRSYSSATSKVSKMAAKGAATVKKSVSKVTVNARTAPVGKKKTSSKVTTLHMSSHGRVLKASKKRDAFHQTTLSTSRNSSMTIVAPDESSGSGGVKSSPKTPKSAKSAKSSTSASAAKSSSGRKSKSKDTSVSASKSKGKSASKTKSPKSTSKSAVQSPRRGLELPRADSGIRMVSPEATITARVFD